MTVETPPKSWLVIVFGLPGSGKTTICSSLQGILPDCVEFDFDDALPQPYKDKMKGGETLNAEERENLMSVYVRVRLYACVERGRALS